MDCKNCGRKLSEDARYCAGCGARQIKERLSFGSLWADFRYRFLNYDNTFLKTFFHLFTRPASVLTHYLDGVRKKYMDPLSYFGIALTLSGLMALLIQTVFKDRIRMDFFGMGTDTPAMRELYRDILDFQAFVFIIFIPIIAFCSWLLLNKRSYYFSEHLVGAIYIMAHFSIATFPISILILAVSPEFYASYGMLTLLLMIMYTLVVYYPISGLRPGVYLLRTLFFIVLFVFLYVLVSNLILMLLFITGVLSPSELIAPQ